ncbi:MAG: ribosome small subunit-dependent GTPase A [Burkholderiaceae bacterium]|nr:ribosome small subunit-dependent GTPase A [Burkholderiaceae bacterium]
MTLALVVGAFRARCIVRTDEGEVLEAVTRSRRSDIAVGDRVRIALTSPAQAVIESVQARSNVFRRSDASRAKLLAVNLSQAAIVLAARPAFSEDVLVRVLIEAEVESIPIALIVNKHDLRDERARIEARIAVYRALGYPVFDCAARFDCERARETLLPWLAGRTTLLLGESGMGKSTLVNCLVPDAGLRTNEISEALGAGRHTTTFTRCFALPHDAATLVIDSPGFQNFGLFHVSQSQRVHAMREFAPLNGTCRFNNCTHRNEPACAIREAAETGRIDPIRYRLYTRLVDEAQALARARPDRV